MAEILPFKAWRYHDDYKPEMASLTSPLFDTASPALLKKLYKNPINSIHLTLPSHGSVPSPASRLKQWKEDQIICQDELPGLYVYYQYFRLPESHELYCRKGFIAFIKAYDWTDQKILRHEDTIAHSVEDRVDLLKNTHLQSSPTHGLYQDPADVLEPFMDQAMQHPLYEFTDFQGITEKLAVISNPSVIAEFLRLFKNQQIILADGHHRLQAAIQYKNECMQSRPHHTGIEAYNYHMMYFTNALSSHLKILPTHRLVRNTGISQEALLSKLQNHFTITEIADRDEISELTIQQKWSYVIMFALKSYLITLKEDQLNFLDPSLPKIVRELDVSVLHHYILDKAVGIPYHKHRYSVAIEYEKSLLRCQRLVSQGDAEFAVLTKGVSIEEVIKVCRSGHTLPQKSTYFYPKALSGLLFGSIKESEFIHFTPN